MLQTEIIESKFFFRTCIITITTSAVAWFSFDTWSCFSYSLYLTWPMWAFVLLIWMTGLLITNSNSTGWLIGTAFAVFPVLLIKVLIHHAAPYLFFLPFSGVAMLVADFWPASGLLCEDPQAQKAAIGWLKGLAYIPFCSTFGFLVYEKRKRLLMWAVVAVATLQTGTLIFVFVN